MQRVNVVAERSPMRRKIDFWLCAGWGEGQHSVGAQIVFEPEEEGTIADPTFSLSFDDAQTLMDELWRCGLRPTEGTGSAGALAATEKHLEDMRKIVFRFLDKVNE